MVKRPHQNMWKQLIRLSGEADETLQVQLRKALARLIVEQRISQEVPLPSSRELAEMLQALRGGRAGWPAERLLMVSGPFLVHPTG